MFPLIYWESSRKSLCTILDSSIDNCYHDSRVVNLWIFKQQQRNNKNGIHQKEEKICHFLSCYQWRRCDLLQHIPVIKLRHVSGCLLAHSFGVFQGGFLIDVVWYINSVHFISHQRLEFQFMLLLNFVSLFIDYSNDLDSPIKVKSVHMSETKHGWRKSERSIGGRPDKSRRSFPAKNTEKTFFILLIPDKWFERDVELFDFVVFRTGEISTKAHTVHDENQNSV